MPHASKTIVINRSPREVFYFLANGLNNPTWRPAVLDIELASGSPGQLGAVYKQGVKGPMGMRLDADYKIVELTPNVSMTFEVVKGPARPTGTFELANSGSATQLTFTLDIQPRGFARLMGPMIQKTAEMEVQTLENLKRHLEQTS